MRASALSFALLASSVTAGPVPAPEETIAGSSVGSSPVGLGMPVLNGSGVRIIDQIEGATTKEIYLSNSASASVEANGEGNAGLDIKVDAATGTGVEKRDEVTPGNATTFRRATVMHHNFHRYNHSSPAIAWNDSLADSAKIVASSCVWAHNTNVNGGNYGQNIAVGLPAKDISSVISDLFYNGEVRAYQGAFGKMPNTNNFEEWGHLTQVVWAATKSVGCANVDCRKTGMQNWPYPENAWFTVCNYYPPGNFNNAYAKNVGASLQRPTVTGARQVDTKAIGQGLWPGKNMSSQ